MKKIVQIVTIPLDKKGWDKDDLIKLIHGTNIYKYPFALAKRDIDFEVINWQTQQFLVLDDNEPKISDWVLYSTDADNKMSGSTCPSRLCRLVAIKEDENNDSPNGKIYIAKTNSGYVNTIYLDKLSKIIASYPQLEGTLPISKETVQAWIDAGTPGEGHTNIDEDYDDWYEQMELTSYPSWKPKLDTQGKLSLGFNDIDPIEKASLIDYQTHKGGSYAKAAFIRGWKSNPATWTDNEVHKLLTSVINDVRQGQFTMEGCSTSTHKARILIDKFKY